MKGGRDVNRKLPYDDSDIESILRYAGRLTGRTLGDFVEGGEILFEDVHTKGRFGQRVEKEYFGIANNNFSEPDFPKVGLELKVTPMMKRGGALASKERLVLSIIDYNSVPETGFDTFLKKGSHILIIFYLWEEGVDMDSYRFLKCVDWRPTEEELRMIHEDWDVIERYIDEGKAHLLSERLTKYLAANTKGAGHGGDLRTQPFSDVPAKQRSLSFKASFMTTLYNTHVDVGELLIDGLDTEDDMRTASVFNSDWPEWQTFEDYVVTRFDAYRGMTCSEIERRLGIDLNPNSKQYYYILTLAMLGVFKRKHVREFEEAGIIVKTVRLKANGTPKESMSFPAIDYDKLVEEAWEDSSFFGLIDHEFLIPVFCFPTKETSGVDRKSLLFAGAFFWYIPDDDLEMIHGVWEDTKEKVNQGDFDHFVRISDHRVAHVRPKARDSSDMYMFRGKEVPKKCFWLNGSYMKSVIAENLGSEGGRQTRL